MATGAVNESAFPLGICLAGLAATGLARVSASGEALACLHLWRGQSVSAHCMRQ